MKDLNLLVVEQSHKNLAVLWKEDKQWGNEVVILPF